MAKRCVCILGLCLFSLPSALLADDRTNIKMNSSYPISVVVGNEVVIAADVYVDIYGASFGRVAMGSNNLSNQPQGMPRLTMENQGYATVDYTVRAEVSGGWTLGTTLGDVGSDKCVLAGIFTAPVLASEMEAPYGRDVSLSDFADNDVLGNTAVAASLTHLFWDEGTDPVWMSGYNVSTIPTGSSIRSMRFLFQAPTADTTGVPHTFLITLSVVIH